jgi:hypothetical protein
MKTLQLKRFGISTSWLQFDQSRVQPRENAPLHPHDEAMS